MAKIPDPDRLSIQIASECDFTAEIARFIVS